MKFTPNDFPNTEAYFSGGRFHPRWHEALEMINRAYEDKKIYNVDYEALKYTIGRLAIDDQTSAFMKTHYYPLLHKAREGHPSGQMDERILPKGADELMYGGWLTSMPAVGAMLKKLNKANVNHPMIKAYTVLVKELAKLTDAMKEIKPYIVKGRKPSDAPAKPENPNKIVKTCPCCFRAIAVSKNGTMAHHGYRRPGDGYQTDSCPGIQFKSLEVSNDGHKYMLDKFRGMITDIDHILNRPGQIMQVPGRAYRSGGTRTQPMIAKGESDFERYLGYYLENQKSMKRHFERTIEQHIKYVAEFRKKHPLT